MDQEKSKAFESFVTPETRFAAQNRSLASFRDSFIDIDTGVNARNGFTWKDYDYFRPEEALPKSTRNLMKMCDVAYKRVPIVRTAIDLMSDFACQGIRIVHPNAKIQDFFNVWWDLVKGNDRSERFLNTLYRRANVIVSRQMGALREGDFDKLEKLVGAPKDFIDIKSKMPKIVKNEIPLAYSFPDACLFNVKSPEISAFLGRSEVLVMKVPEKLRKIVKNPKTDEEREFVDGLPENVVAEIRQGKQEITLDPTFVNAYHYKKDDWEEWATPMLACILDSLIMVEKMHLADRSALDGAISNVRLWILGDLEKEIVPSPDVMNRFSDLITNHPGGGTLDLIWGPAIKLQESNTNVHQFLGSAKYDPYMSAIFQGLGIPQTLTGSTNASGTTNNFISMKILIERLEYGRMVLKRFWQRELEIIRQARGFRFPAEIHFERMSLSDEVAEKALLRDLYDRGLISSEALLQHFGEIPDLERIRVVKENKEREAGRRSPQGGPWNNPEQEHDLEKIALQGQMVTPTEIGMELEPRKKGEVPLAEQQFDIQKQQMELNHELAKKQQTLDHELQRDQHEFDKGLKEKKQIDDQKIKRQQIRMKPKGQPGQGRPKNKKDSNKRKQRTVKPRTSATQIQVWAAEAQERISNLVVPEYLKSVGKKNLRQLTNQEFDGLESRKFATLSNLIPFEEVTDADLVAKFNDTAAVVSTPVYDIYVKAISGIKSPTVNNLRQLQVISYTKAQRLKARKESA
jgi:hypothetical protein